MPRGGRKAKGRVTYEQAKPKIWDMVVKGCTLDEIESSFEGVTTRTVRNWRKRVVEEEGRLSDEKIREMREEFIAENRGQFALAKRELLSIIEAASVHKPGTRILAVNSLIGVLRSEADLLARFGGLEPESFELRVSSSYDQLRSEVRSLLSEERVYDSEAVVEDDDED